jgi:hypothetical protein
MGGKREVAARVLAAVAAVFWGFLFYGLQDLLTVFIEGPKFAQHYLVESGWGLMFLVMVAVPFAALVIRPGCLILVWSLLCSGVALVLGGLLAMSLWQTVPGMAVAATGGVVGVLGGAPLRPPDLRPDVPLVILVLVASPPALSYAGNVAEDPRATESTWFWMHGAIQAGMAVAVVLITALVALTPPQPGRVVVTLTATVTVGFLGTESLVYPDRVGTLGTMGGGVAAMWSVAFLLLVARKSGHSVGQVSATRPA